MMISGGIGEGLNNSNAPFSLKYFRKVLDVSK
jgi:hypothetical protein